MADTTETTTNGAGTLRAPTAPADVVRRFLGGLADGDLDGALALLDDDVEYVNVSLPAIRGRDRVARAFRRAMGMPGAGFDVVFHAVSSEGDTVLTERTDVLVVGRLRVQIWVCGRFDVHDGRITLWRDYFDWLNVGAALLRGLLGAAVPALAPRLPAPSK